MRTMTLVCMFASTSSLPVATRKSSMNGFCVYKILFNSSSIVTSVNKSCRPLNPILSKHCAVNYECSVSQINLKVLNGCGLSYYCRNCDLADTLRLRYKYNKFCIHFVSVVLVALRCNFTVKTSLHVKHHIKDSKAHVLESDIVMICIILSHSIVIFLLNFLQVKVSGPCLYEKTGQKG